MRKKLIVIFLFLVFPFFVSAYTKEDIIDLVTNQKVCDQETETLYNRYFKLYSRLLKSKDVSQENIDIVYNNLTSVLKTIKKENICSVDDLDRIPSSLKSEIYNTLYDTSALVIKSPDLEDAETTIKYNDDNTIEFYENGEYLDKVTLSRTTFNYVGFSKFFVSLKYILPIFLILSLFLLFKEKEKKKLNEILIVIVALILVINILFFRFGTFFYDAYNLINSLNYIENKSIVKMEVKNKEIVKYPTYESEYARLKIDGLDIDLPIYYGDSKEVLKNGIGFTGSFPGFKGTTILSGHNSKTSLNNLKNIKFYDIITIETNYGVFKYGISKMETLKYDQYASLEKGDKTLIIYTCYPFDEIIYSNYRFVIYADLVKEEWAND